MTADAVRGHEQVTTASTSSFQHSENRPLLAASTAPSRAESIRSFVTDNESQIDRITPVPSGQKNRSLSAPAIPVHKRPYRGYESEEAYLAAFTEFLKEKEYFETDMQLTGFYGRKTMADYLKEPGGFRVQSKKERVRDREKQRLKGAARLPELTEGDEEGGRVGEVDGVLEGEAEGRPSGLRKMSKSFARVFTRRGTVA